MVTLGSCFAEVIGSRLRENKVQSLVNPFGTIFNPLSAGLLLRAAAGHTYNFAEHLVQHNGIWYAYDLHSSLSSPNKEALLQLIQERLEQTRQALAAADLLILTLGTAVGYRLNSNGTVVANCHKLPAKQFTRQLLTVEEIINALQEALTHLRELNPTLQVLLTVSPVRHVKETLEINSVSKAVLRVVCHQLTSTHEQVRYFPAYELMLDDLRDYRFYKQDMLHPTETAEEYIWQKFTAAYFDEGFASFLVEWEKIQRALAHKPFHPSSEAHQKFLQHTLQQLQHLQSRYGLDVSAETRQLQEQLT